MDISILEDIGLSNAEIKVYLALLELGSSTAGPLIEKSGLQSSVVHMTLGKLVARGFISVVQEGKRRHYQAANPEHIVAYLDEKKARFQELLPQLVLCQQMARAKPETVTFRGVRGIKEILLELLEAGGPTHHTFGSSVKSLMLGDAWWVSYHRQRAAKGIRAQLLFNESLASWKAEAKYPLAEVRYTSTGFEPLTETIIRGECVAILLWTDVPLGILVRNKELAESYEHFFRLLWNGAR